MVVVAVFALAFILVLFLCSLRPSSDKRAVNVDVVENGQAEVVGARVLPFIKDDGQTFHGLVADGGQNGSIFEGQQRKRAAPTKALPPLSSCGWGIHVGGRRGTAEEINVRRVLGGNDVEPGRACTAM